MMLATPRTWVVGEVVTAAQLNAELRDQINALINGMLHVVKSGNTARTSTTSLANDPHLALSVAANSTYLFDGFVDYDGAFGAGSLKMDFTLPASAVLRWGPLGNVVSETTQKYTSNTTASGSMSVGTYGTGGLHTAATLRGYLTVAATAGTMQMRWAQDGSNGTATTVYAGSWLRLYRVT
ncbi:hypothetical protein ACTVZO_05505 [Streptomyces sp. IBSNAI002]|uniref:hypothetical protein n=1 Tax=Streptomyces sp. IBSNAI002 TaxID=3457500 RepID=UPI003FD18B48